MWRTPPGFRPGAESTGRRLAFLLALYLDRNLRDAMACEMAIEFATRAQASPDYRLEVASHNALSIVFEASLVRIEHEVTGLGSLRIDAGQFAYLLAQWLRVLRSSVPIETTVMLELPPPIRRPTRRAVRSRSPIGPAGPGARAR
ncbi:hypothetical protein [Variovorax saccharolyticus]|uniref:hypothetical protein n=1 Tax=Variovorax saccharolyticus TaxID=3053516 RepID=UPI002576425B|nr:hypothetical protein [Variovorax sp. J22R187]MDM0020127.1 hypothetical protein [Variovorax sp. J22R187]